MVIIKECFERCNKNNLINAYLNLLSDDTDKGYEAVIVSSWIDRILKTDANHCDLCFIVPYMSFTDNNPMLEVSKVIADEIVPHDEMIGVSDNKLSDMDIYDLRLMHSKINTPEHYAVDFIENSDVLGYYITDMAIDTYGLENIMAAVIYEMTFLGYEDKEKEEEKTKINETVQECINEITNQDSDSSHHCFKKVTLHELMDKIGFVDTRTEQEKEKDEKQRWIDIIKTRVSFAESVSCIKKEIQNLKKEEEDE